MDEQRRTECAFWIAFWGQVSTDRRLRRINGWVHGQYLRLFERCLAQGWAAWPEWSANTREPVLRSLVTFINGLTAGAVANAGDWPPERQVEQLRLQLELLHGWALGSAERRRGRVPRVPERCRALPGTLRILPSPQVLESDNEEPAPCCDS